MKFSWQIFKFKAELALNKIEKNPENALNGYKIGMDPLMQRVLYNN